MRAELATSGGIGPQWDVMAPTRHANAPDGTSLPLRLLTPPDGSFGAAVRAGRAARGWTAARLGRVAGCNAKTIRDVERGRGMRRETARKLAAVLGLAAPARLVVRRGEHRERYTAGEFGALLRRWRTRAVLSQNALAGAVGIDASTINRLESGERTAASRPVVEALADALDLEDEETDDLLLAAGHLPSWSGDVTVRQCAALLACLPGPAARRLREQIAAAWEREQGGDE